MKGIQAVRRDNCKLVKIICEGVIDSLLNRNFDISGAADFVKSWLDKLVANEVPLELLTSSKGLTRPKHCDFAVGEKKCKRPQHFIVKTDDDTKLSVCEPCKHNFFGNQKCELTALKKGLAHQTAAKMFQRDQASAPRPPDRVRASLSFLFLICVCMQVEFVFVETVLAKKGYEKVEDPEFVRANPDVKIDARHYITNQLMNPVCDLLELNCNPKEDIFQPFLQKWIDRDNEEKERTKMEANRHKQAEKARVKAENDRLKEERRDFIQKRKALEANIMNNEPGLSDEKKESARLKRQATLAAKRAAQATAGGQA